MQMLWDRRESTSRITSSFCFASFLSASFSRIENRDYNNGEEGTDSGHGHAQRCLCTMQPQIRRGGSSSEPRGDQLGRLRPGLTTSSSSKSSSTFLASVFPHTVPSALFSWKGSSRKSVRKQQKGSLPSELYRCIDGWEGRPMWNATLRCGTSPECCTLGYGCKFVWVYPCCPASRRRIKQV